MAISSAAIRAGKAYYELQGLDKTAAAFTSVERRLKGLGSRLATIGAITTAAGLGIGLAFVRPVKDASDFQESLSKFETVFDDQAKAAKAWGDEYANQVGRSKAQLVDFLAQAQDTFVPLGFDPAEAEQFSKDLTKLAIDLASFNNISDEQAFERLISSVVGNTENLRAFGVVAQDAQIKAEALAMGFDPSNLSAYQKAQVIMSLAVKGTAAAQGDAIRTAGGYANQVKRLEGNLRDMRVEIGSALLPALTTILKTMNPLVNIAAVFATKYKALTITLAALTAALVALGIGITAVGLLAFAFGSIAGAIGFLLTPMGLIIAAFVIGPLVTFAWIAALLYFSGILGSTGRLILAVFNNVRKIVGSSMSAIGALLAAGKIEAAAKVAWWTFQVAALKAFATVLGGFRLMLNAIIAGMGGLGNLFAIAGGAALVAEVDRATKNIGFVATMMEERLQKLLDEINKDAKKGVGQGSDSGDGSSGGKSFKGFDARGTFSGVGASRIRGERDPLQADIADNTKKTAELLAMIASRTELEKKLSFK